MARRVPKGLDRYAISAAAGDVLFREGEPGDRMYVIAEGRMRIVKRIEDADVTIASLGAGDCFGEMALLDDQPRSATAIVAEDARLVPVDRSTFEQLVRENGEVAVRIMRKLSSRLREANRRLAAYLAENGARRAVEALRSAADPPGRNGRRLLPSAISPEWLALRAGLSLVDADEAWLRLRAAGVVLTDGEGLCLASDATTDDYIAYLDQKREYDPVTTRELADMTGLPEEAAHHIARKVLAACLAAPGRLAGGYHRYLALKKRFEYPDAA